LAKEAAQNRQQLSASIPQFEATHNLRGKFTNPALQLMMLKQQWEHSSYGQLEGCLEANCQKKNPDKLKPLGTSWDIFS